MRWNSHLRWEMFDFGLTFRLSSKGKGEGLTLAQMAANLHGRIPLPILAGAVIVLPFQGIALITEVLDHGALSQPTARGRVAVVATVLRLAGRLAIWKKDGTI